MRRIFSSQPLGGPFRLFSRLHLSALAATAAGVAGTVWAGRRLGPVGRRRLKVGVAAGLMGQELIYHAWRARSGTWTVQEMLPLHLCSVLVWGNSLTFLRPCHLGEEVAWYWGMAGVPQALLTPDIGPYSWPHFRYVQFFTSHGFLLTVPLWHLLVEGKRPTAAGGFRAFGLLLTQAGVAYLVNRRLGSNYMFVNRRLDTPSILDAMPPWPRYLPILVGMAAATFTAAWAPFGIVDALRARRPRRR